VVPCLDEKGWEQIRVSEKNKGGGPGPAQFVFFCELTKKAGSISLCGSKLRPRDARKKARSVSSKVREHWVNLAQKDLKGGEISGQLHVVLILLA